MKKTDVASNISFANKLPQLALPGKGKKLDTVDSNNKRISPVMPLLRASKALGPGTLEISQIGKSSDNLPPPFSNASVVRSPLGVSLSQVKGGNLQHSMTFSATVLSPLGNRKKGSKRCARSTYSILRQSPYIPFRM